MNKPGGTGIVMLNLGGPATLDDVEPFLLVLEAADAGGEGSEHVLWEFGVWETVCISCRR